MPRPRIPAALHELRGSYKKNPNRRRSEPEPSGPLGDPPVALAREERACWRELASLAPAGVFGNADRWAIEIASRLMARLRKDGIGGRGLNNGELSQLNGLLGRFGMTPADRSKVNVPKADKEDNAFAQIAAAGGGKATTPVN